MDHGRPLPRRASQRRDGPEQRRNRRQLPVVRQRPGRQPLRAIQANTSGLIACVPEVEQRREHPEHRRQLRAAAPGRRPAVLAAAVVGRRAAVAAVWLRRPGAAARVVAAVVGAGARVGQRRAPVGGIAPAAFRSSVSDRRRRRRVGRGRVGRNRDRGLRVKRGPCQGLPPAPPHPRAPAAACRPPVGPPHVHGRRSRESAHPNQRRRAAVAARRRSSRLALAPPRCRLRRRRRQRDQPGAVHVNRVADRDGRDGPAHHPLQAAARGRPRAARATRRPPRRPARAPPGRRCWSRPRPPAAVTAAWTAVCVPAGSACAAPPPRTPINSASADRAWRMTIHLREDPRRLPVSTRSLAVSRAAAV